MTHEERTIVKEQLIQFLTDKKSAGQGSNTRNPITQQGREDKIIQVSHKFDAAVDDANFEALKSFLFEYSQEIYSGPKRDSTFGDALSVVHAYISNAVAYDVTDSAQLYVSKISTAIYHRKLKRERFDSQFQLLALTIKSKLLEQTVEKEKQARIAAEQSPCAEEDQRVATLKRLAVEAAAHVTKGKEDHQEVVLAKEQQNSFVEENNANAPVLTYANLESMKNLINTFLEQKKNAGPGLNTRNETTQRARTKMIAEILQCFSAVIVEQTVENWEKLLLKLVVCRKETIGNKKTDSTFGDALRAAHTVLLEVIEANWSQEASQCPILAQLRELKQQHLNAFSVAVQCGDDEFIRGARLQNAAYGNDEVLESTWKTEASDADVAAPVFSNRRQSASGSGMSQRDSIASSRQPSVFSMFPKKSMGKTAAAFTTDIKLEKCNTSMSKTSDRAKDFISALSAEIFTALTGSRDSQSSHFASLENFSLLREKKSISGLDEMSSKPLSI
jgi:hypothetical protein